MFARSARKTPVSPRNEVERFSIFEKRSTSFRGETIDELTSHRSVVEGYAATVSGGSGWLITCTGISGGSRLSSRN